MAQNDRTHKGPRKPTDNIDDSSSVGEKVQDGDIMVTPPEEHILERFRRYFKLLARVQAIEEMTGLKYIVLGGPSKYQDVRGNKKYHACHVLRVGEVNPCLERKNKALYDAVTNFVGHTQYAISAVNQWSDIGGAIDKFQSANLKGLDGLSYGSKGYGAVEKKKLQEMLNDMSKIISKHPTYCKKAKEWIDKHNTEEGLKQLYQYMQSKFEEVKKGQFVKQWGKKR